MTSNGRPFVGYLLSSLPLESAVKRTKHGVQWNGPSRPEVVFGGISPC